MHLDKHIADGRGRGSGEILESLILVVDGQSMNHMLVEKQNGFLKQQVYGAFDLRNSYDGY